MVAMALSLLWLRYLALAVACHSASLQRVTRRGREDAAYGTYGQSLEITITETPRVNWGIRGQNAADLTLNYRVEV
jgi:hypothetical protein